MVALMDNNKAVEIGIREWDGENQGYGPDGRINGIISGPRGRFSINRSRAFSLGDITSSASM